MVNRHFKWRLVGPAAFLALGLLALVVVAAGSLIGPGGPTHHLDGAGPLASRNDPGNESMAVEPLQGLDSWTYGLRLCLTTGAGPAVIESVTPHATIGIGFRLMGVKIREFTPSMTHTPIISVDGYPPPSSYVPDPLHDIDRYTVTTPCSDDPLVPYTELLVGLARQGTDGGGWQGLDVAYEFAGRQYVLFTNHYLLICGGSLADYCRGPAPATP